MSTGSYEIVYFITGILSTYSKYIFMNIFAVEDPYVSKRNNLLLFTAYHFIVGLTYLLFSTPSLTAMTNILCFIVLFWLNLRDIKRTLMAIALMMVVSVCIELIGIFAIQLQDSPSNFNEAYKYRSVISITIVNVAQYVTAMLISRFAKNKAGIDLPNRYWLAILIIPIGTAYFLFLMLTNMQASETLVVTVCTLIILMNLVVFLMFDVIKRFYREKEEKEAMNLLSVSGMKQLELIEQSTQNVRAVRHDLKRHLSMVGSMIRDEELVHAAGYIDDIVASELEPKTFCKTGNYIIDSIVNYELGMYDLGEILFTNKIKQVPSEIDIKDYELTSIISNVLSNARQGLEKVSDNKLLEIRLEYEKGMLYISVKNAFNGEIKAGNGTIYTTKSDDTVHGFGLKNVQKIVEKYDGEITVVYDDRIFSVEMVMYA